MRAARIGQGRTCCRTEGVLASTRRNRLVERTPAVIGKRRIAQVSYERGRIILAFMRHCGGHNLAEVGEATIEGVALAFDEAVVAGQFGSEGHVARCR